MTETANAVWGIFSVLAVIVFFTIILRNRGTNQARERLERAEVPVSEPQAEGTFEENAESWVDVAAFPMEHRNIQPLGAQMVTQKTFHDHMADFLKLLEQEGIAYQTHVDPASMFQAEAVRVPKEQWEKAKAIFDKLKPRDELY